MNAAHHITPLGKFKWLLKREYWENRGGFVWAQVITGGIAILFASIGALIGVFAARNSDGINHMGDVSEYLKVMGDTALEGQLKPVESKAWTPGPSCQI